MKAGKLGLLSVALVLGLSACNLINGPDNTDPTDPTSPTDPTDPGTGGPGTGGPGGGSNLPDSAFGVSTSASGPFTASGLDGGPIQSESDPRVITVSPGDTFYAQVKATADEPIDDIEIFLANSAPEGIRKVLPSAGFSVVGEPTGDCDLDGTSEEVTCTFAINVAAGTQEIEDLPGSGSEFAYVFRPFITVGDVTSEPTTYRGYVDIE